MKRMLDLQAGVGCMLSSAIHFAEGGYDMKKGLTMLLVMLLCTALAAAGMAQGALSFTPDYFAHS